MAAYTYGAQPEHVVTDKSGNVQEGTYLEVWTAEGGTQITALLDLDDNLLPGHLTTTADGRYRFKINSQRYPTVWIHDPDGTSRNDWWQIEADQGVGKGLEALSKAEQALTIATETSNALGEITILVNEQFATEGQMTGVEDATSAWQAAVDTGANRIIFPAGSRWLFDGSDYVQLRSHQEIDLMGTTVFKKDGAGYYNILNASTQGRAGWGAGITDVVIRNGYFEGNLAGGGSLALLTAHHASRFLIENMEFVGCMIGGHLIDLAGCEEFTIRGIIMRGWKVPESTTTPRHEAIQLDQSLKGAGSPDTSGFDGLLCRRMTIRDVISTSWTDPANGTVYPAPNPVGSHGQREGQWYEDVFIGNILVVDPALDPGATNIVEQDATIRGIIHFPTVKRITIDTVKVIATDGQGSIRSIMIQSRASGTLASGDPNSETTSGAWAVPQASADIQIRNVSVYGMNGTASALSPPISLLGCEGAFIKNVTIDAVVQDNYKEAIYLNRCEDVQVTANITRSETGIRTLNGCRRIDINASFDEVRIPVRPADSNNITINGRGVHSGSTSNFVAVTGTTDVIAIGSLVASGWAKLYSVEPPSHAEGAVLFTPYVAG